MVFITQRRAGEPGCTIGIVLPVLDEAANLEHLIPHLASSRADQVVVVDGGSSDGSWEILEKATSVNRWVLVQSPRGRARQMNAGIAHCNCKVILFLHADTRLPRGAVDAVRHAVDEGGHCWGRFNVSFESRSRAMGVVAWFMNKRSCLTGICTGDQAMFATRQALARVDGFPDMVLMEDIELSRRLKRLGPPCCLSLPVTTSARRWQQDGLLRTMCAMWWMRMRYWLGAKPETLADGYRHVR